MKRPVIVIIIILAAVIVVCAALAAASVIMKKTGAILPLKYGEELKAAADRYGLDRSLVAAVVNTESGFDKDAMSAVGARGLMQLMPETAEWIAAMRGLEIDAESLFDPETNLDYGCWLLSYLLDMYQGNIRYALIAYNAGPGKLREWLDTRADENGELTEIPYPETRNYVKKVMDLMEKYAEKYEKELMEN